MQFKFYAAYTIILILILSKICADIIKTCEYLNCRFELEF